MGFWVFLAATSAQEEEEQKTCAEIPEPAQAAEDPDSAFHYPGLLKIFSVLKTTFCGEKMPSRTFIKSGSQFLVSKLPRIG